MILWINNRAKAQTKVSPLRRIVDDWKKPAIDNVWIVKNHQQPIYALKEALECHRESHHPTMYNKPDAHVKAFIELDMQVRDHNLVVKQLYNY